MKKKLLSLLFALVTCTVLCTLSASAAVVECKVGPYTNDVILFDTATGTVTGAAQPQFIVTANIPATINGVAVKAIGEKAFEWDCQDLLETVSIPEGVTTIGADAFGACYHLKSMTLPSTLKTIGDKAFRACQRMKNVTLYEGLTSIGTDAFRGCSGFTTVTIPGTVTTIGDTAFYMCERLTSLTISQGVTSIGAEAFHGAPITALTLPDSVTTLGEGAFSSCSKVKTLALPANMTTVPTGAFRYCAGITSLTIPDGVTSIGADAFYSCTSLETLTIPASVTSIGANAFNAAIKLQTVYYGGSKAQWGAMDIQNSDGGNAYLVGSPVRYAVESGTPEPEVEQKPGDLKDGWYHLSTMGNYVNMSRNTVVTYVELRNNADNDVFYITNQGNNQFTLQTEDLRYLAIANFIDGASLYKTMNPFVWSYYNESGDDTFSIRPAQKTSLVLNAEGEQSADGTEVIVWTHSGMNAPRHAEFRFIPGEDPTIPQAPKHPFTDVVAGSYYESAVIWALENNITTGVTATTFQPSATCTRGQVVTFLWRTAGCPEPTTTVNPFTDVAADSFCYKAVLWAVEQGITTGVTATTFQPSATCTSGHVITFLYRANGSPNKTGQGAFYADAVTWGNQNALLAGTATAFTPTNNAPRADIVYYLHNYATVN